MKKMRRKQEAFAFLGHFILMLVQPLLEILIVAIVAFGPFVLGWQLQDPFPRAWLPITIVVSLILLWLGSVALKWIRANGLDWPGPS